jgi:hypothetical protein
MEKFDLYGFQEVMYRLQHEESQANIVVHYYIGRKDEVPTAEIQDRIHSYLNELELYLIVFGFSHMTIHIGRVRDNFKVAGGIKYHSLETELKYL